MNYDRLPDIYVPANCTYPNDTVLAQGTCPCLVPHKRVVVESLSVQRDSRRFIPPVFGADSVTYTANVDVNL